MADRSKFEINGIINTSNNVLSNIELLASSAGSFITWDSQLGQWAVIVNETGTSVKSFDDSNILGAINVSGTGVSELYNSVQIAYPHKDLRDATDYVTVSISTADRFPQEIDNQLQITLDTINNPIQAQILASQELKQNRVDKIVQFRSDYTANGLKAGDLIDITNTVYGYTNKVFRIIQIEEEDTDEGAIIYSITGLEYDANVYTTTNLEYNFRTTVNSIPSRITNEAIQQSDEADFGGTIAKLAGANALLGIVNGLFKKFVTADPETGVLTEDIQFNDENAQKLFEAGIKKPEIDYNNASEDSICEGESVTFTFGSNCFNNTDLSCLFNMPTTDYDYEITGLDATQITSLVVNGESVTVNDDNLSGTLTFSPGNTQGTIVITTLGDTSSTPDDGATGTDDSVTLTLDVEGNSSSVTVNQYQYETFSTVVSPTSITEGGSATFTVNTTNVPDGTTIPWAITGSAIGKVSSATSGTLTINSNTASVSVSTSDDGDYQGTQSLTFTISPSGLIDNECHGTWDFTASLTVLDNDTAPPTPPADTTCEYTQVPIVWCGIYDGTSGALKGVTVRRYAYLPIPQAGESTVTVPLTCSVSGGAMSIDSTVDVASSSSLGGIPYNVITSFNSVAPEGLITGTTTTVYGYDL